MSTVMDELKDLIGPAALAKIAREMFAGTGSPKLRAALEWSLAQDRLERQARED
jgi:hypothetical protein